MTTTNSLTPKVLQVKLQYDRCNPREVYAAIKGFYPTLAASDFTPDQITPFIPEDVDPAYWTKTLRNVEYNLTHPKSRKRTRCNTISKRHNYAADVAHRDRMNILAKTRPAPYPTFAISGGNMEDYL